MGMPILTTPLDTSMPSDWIDLRQGGKAHTPVRDRHTTFCLADGNPSGLVTRS
jgi:hypothetical protein